MEETKIKLKSFDATANMITNDKTFYLGSFTMRIIAISKEFAMAKLNMLFVSEIELTNVEIKEIK